MFLEQPRVPLGLCPVRWIEVVSAVEHLEAEIRERRSETIGHAAVIPGRQHGHVSGPWGDVAPTGVRAIFSGVNIFRIRDGRVVELWNHRDDLGLMEQVGAPVFAGSPRDPTGESADRAER